MTTSQKSVTLYTFTEDGQYACPQQVNLSDNDWYTAYKYAARKAVFERVYEYTRDSGQPYSLRVGVSFNHEGDNMVYFTVSASMEVRIRTDIVVPIP